MAPKKLSAKRSRRDATAEGTNVAPEFDSHRFRSAEHQQRFEAIKGWSFHRERRVQLRDDDQFLGDPLVLEEGQEYEFSQRRNRADGFDEEAIAQLLCTPGQDFARTAVGRRVRIMRTSMTTLTLMWMTLLLNNVLPSDHNFDLPLPKCQLVYVILTRMSVHVAQLIVDAIYLFAGMPPTRHPLDLDKSNRALGFPPLITGLYQSFGVPVTPSKVIRPPITRAFIEKYCTPRQAQSDAPQATDAPPPTHEADPAGAEVAWPGDWPEAHAGEAPAGSPADAEEARMDEEMTDLLGFLGGSRATGDGPDDIREPFGPALFHLLSSRGGGPDDMREPFGPALFYLLSSRGGGPDDMREPFGPVLFHLLSSRGGGPDDMWRQIMVIRTLLLSRRSCPVARRDKLWSFCASTPRLNYVQGHAETNYGHSAPCVNQEEQTRQYQDDVGRSTSKEGQLSYPKFHPGTILLLGCDPHLTPSRYLAPIVRQFMMFRDMPEVKRKHWGANSNQAHLGLPGSSPRSNLARLGELGGKLLPHFPINWGRREEQKCSTLLVSENHLKLVRKIVSVKKIQAEALP
ncbi:hypothetical protein HKD37_19G053246 [Glycine soja]